MKTTLIVDGNWLLMSRVFALADMFQQGNTPEQKEQGQNRLIASMAKSCTYVMNSLGDYIDHVIIVGDGGSWRKQIHHPSSLNGVIYKGNRKSQSELDWNYIWGALNIFMQKFKEWGVTVSQYEQVEGDDWIWYWSRKLNNNRQNAIIWSSDNDLKQLVQYKDGCFTAWYNTRSGLFMPKAIQEMDDLEIMMNPLGMNNYLWNFLSKFLEVNYVYPDDIVMTKIICGDTSDNIKSIVRVVKNGRTFKVSERDWKGIKKELDIEDLQQFFDKRDDIIQAIRKLKKYSDCKQSLKEIKEEFEYNKQLVWLDESVVPSSILESMCQFDFSKHSVNELRLQCTTLYNNTDMIEEIFNGI